MIDMSWVEAHQGLLLSLAGLSVLMFVGSLIALPFLLARIPEDYFVDPRRHSARMKSLHPVAYLSLRLLKNLVGWILILAGILMLVLPGQGILTIIMGLVLSDFPGKYALERRLASNRRVLSGINWIRRRGGHAPLMPPQIETKPA
ncbi:PGPGW domain-containing protein [Thiocapsa sp.]|uniref:PGPGW domain-containing protein n=1 Tax=Thiocapsa sp. TaxID=2024551 RepID=UPI0025E8FD44|nr:PGPGW domain-containing protein [Thiocapsa sp.]